MHERDTQRERQTDRQKGISRNGNICQLASMSPNNWHSTDIFNFPAPREVWKEISPRTVTLATFLLDFNLFNSILFFLFFLLLHHIRPYFLVHIYIVWLRAENLGDRLSSHRWRLVDKFVSYHVRHVGRNRGKKTSVTDTPLRLLQWMNTDDQLAWCCHQWCDREISTSTSWPLFTRWTTSGVPTPKEG